MIIGVRMDDNEAVEFVADALMKDWFKVKYPQTDEDLWREIALDDARVCIDAYIEWLERNNNDKSSENV